RMARPLEPHDAAALDVQRRVLLEELRERSQNRFRAVAFEHIHRRLYPEGHAYHRPPAGEPDDIHAVTADDLEAFIASYLCPTSTVLELLCALSVAPPLAQSGL